MSERDIKPENAPIGWRCPTCGGGVSPYCDRCPCTPRREAVPQQVPFIPCASPTMAPRAPAWPAKTVVQRGSSWLTGKFTVALATEG